jgi:hypothetical protein
MSKGSDRRLFLAAVRHYSDGAMSCARCGRKDRLSIDHIVPRSGNRTHASETDVGSYLWRRLEREGYPSGYAVLCGVCNSAKGGQRPKPSYPTDSLGRPLLSVTRSKLHDRRGHHSMYSTWAKPGDSDYSRTLAEAARIKWESQNLRPADNDRTRSGRSVLGRVRVGLSGPSEWREMPSYRIRVGVPDVITVGLKSRPRGASTGQISWDASALLPFKIRFELETGLRLPLKGRGIRSGGQRINPFTGARQPLGFIDFLRNWANTIFFDGRRRRPEMEKHYYVPFEGGGFVFVSYEIGALRAMISDEKLKLNFVNYVRSAAG